MVLVAIYFWAPIVSGWAGRPARKPTTVAGGLILDDEPVDPAAQARRARQTFPWEKVRKQVLADPRMTAVAFQTSWHNPFRGLDQTVEPTSQPPLETGPSDLDP